MGFVANSICFPAIQKFGKLVKILQSYREFKGGDFLRHSVGQDAIAENKGCRCLPAPASIELC